MAQNQLCSSGSRREESSLGKGFSNSFASTGEWDRFSKLGIPVPHFTANFVACRETGGGHGLISGLLAHMIAIPIRCRNDRGDLVDENLGLPWNPALATTAGPAEDWNVGGPAGGALRLRANVDALFLDRRARPMVRWILCFRKKGKSTLFHVPALAGLPRKESAKASAMV
jgi:hypothetical protein